VRQPGAPPGAFLDEAIRQLIQIVALHRRRDHRRTYPAGRADRAEQVGSVVAIVAHHGRPRADRRPDISVRTFLSDRGLVLKPNLDRRAGGAAAKYLFQQRTEVFLKAIIYLTQ